MISKFKKPSVKLTLTAFLLVFIAGCASLSTSKTEMETGNPDITGFLERNPNKEGTPVGVRYNEDDWYTIELTDDAEIIVARGEKEEELSHSELPNLVGKGKLWLTPEEDKVQRIVMVDFERSDIVELMSSRDDENYRIQVFTEDTAETHNKIEECLNTISDIAPQISFNETDLNDDCMYVDLLEITELPKYYVLDTEDIALRTAEWEEVVDYLVEELGGKIGGEKVDEIVVEWDQEELDLIKEQFEQGSHVSRMTPEYAAAEDLRRCWSEDWHEDWEMPELKSSTGEQVQLVAECRDNSGYLLLKLERLTLPSEEIPQDEKKLNQPWFLILIEKYEIR